LILFIIPAEAQYNEWTQIYKEEEQIIHYELYAPHSDKFRRSPVLICVGGLPIIDGQYVHSSTEECSSQKWTEFANQNNVAILGLGFLFNDEQWNDKTSYQYAQVWSGRAVWKLLESLAKENHLDINHLYTFGISAGAQFAVRFAQVYPDQVKLVAAHAAGGYDFPQQYIAPKFLITVGELDEEEITRVQWAKAFTEVAQEQEIDVRLEIIPGIGHIQTEYQNQLSREFFKQWEPLVLYF